MHAPGHEHRDLGFCCLGDIPRPSHGLVDAAHDFYVCCGVEAAPRLREPILDFERLHRLVVGVKADEIGSVPGLLKCFVGAEDNVREGVRVIQGACDSAKKGAREGVGIAGLLVKEEDAGWSLGRDKGARRVFFSGRG